VHKVTGDLVHWFQTDTGVSPAELTWHIGPTAATAQQGKAAADDSSNSEVQPLEGAAAALDVDALVQVLALTVTAPCSVLLCSALPSVELIVTHTVQDITTSSLAVKYRNCC
jgi:hypothetical protein